jgi:hypothetical protein
MADAPLAPVSREPVRLEMADLLSMVPMVNRAVRASRHNRTLILYVPVRKRWWMGPPLSWLPGVEFRREKGVALDAMGEAVWSACDGDSTVEQIVDRFARQHKLRFHEARLHVMTFMQMLMQRNLIVLVGQDQAPPPGQRRKVRRPGPIGMIEGARV